VVARAWSAEELWDILAEMACGPADQVTEPREITLAPRAEACTHYRAALAGDSSLGRPRAEAVALGCDLTDGR
jgi:hypothetical protein